MTINLLAEIKGVNNKIETRYITIINFQETENFNNGNPLVYYIDDGKIKNYPLSLFNIHFKIIKIYD